MAGRLALPLIPLALLLGVWALSTELWLTQSRVFPSPGDVLAELELIVRGEGPVNSTYSDAAATLTRVVIAFVLSMAIGVALGIAAGRNRLVFDFLSNPMWISMAVPSVIWAFIFVVIFGTENTVPILALMALIVPKVVLTVGEGTKAIPRDLLDMARSYSAPRLSMARDVYLPYLVPFIASSARVGFALAVKISVVAEVIGLERGIGYELDFWYTQTTLAPVVAWGVVMIAFGMLVDALVFGPLERRAARWRERDEHGPPTLEVL